MPRYGVYGPRLFGLLSGLREEASGEWLRGALKEVRQCEAGFTFQETPRGYRFRRKGEGFCCYNCNTTINIYTPKIKGVDTCEKKQEK